MDRTVWASPAAPKSWKWLLASFSTVKPACLKYRAYDGGVRKAKQFELGVLPHLPAVAVVSVPSRLPNTIWAPFLSSGRTARKYVPGSGGRSGVLPSIMSPTAVRVTEAPAVDFRGSAAARCVAALARAAGWLEPDESAAGEAAVPPGGLPKEQAETTSAMARPTNARSPLRRMRPNLARNGATCGDVDRDGASGRPGQGGRQGRLDHPGRHVRDLLGRAAQVTGQGLGGEAGQLHRDGVDQPRRRPAGPA